MRIGFAGAGRVGTTLGRYLSENNIQISGYYSRTRMSAQESAEFVSCGVFDSLTQLTECCDIIFITVCDSAIKQIWDSIVLSGVCVKGKIFCHCSGLLTSEIFEGCGKYGAYACSLHMMQAVNDRFSSYKMMKYTQFTAEGNEHAAAVISEIITGCSNRVYEIQTDKKILYHTAAAIVSNLVDGLINKGFSIMSKCGLDAASAASLMAPLIRGNIENILNNGTVSALTGPLERNDTDTVRKHIECLDTEGAAMYRSVSLEVLKAAKIKNPLCDYKQMEAVLRTDRKEDTI